MGFLDISFVLLLLLLLLFLLFCFGPLQGQPLGNHFPLPQVDKLLFSSAHWPLLVLLLSLYFSLCFVHLAQSVEKQFCLLYVTFLFCFIKVSLLFLLYLFISLFVLSAQPNPWRNNFACFMSLIFFVLSRCHFFFFFISLFLSLFCLPSPVHGETILLALCHFSFFVLSRCQMIGIRVCWVACVSLIFLSYFT